MDLRRPLPPGSSGSMSSTRMRAPAASRARSQRECACSWSAAAAAASLREDGVPAARNGVLRRDFDLRLKLNVERQILTRDA